MYPFQRDIVLRSSLKYLLIKNLPSIIFINISISISMLYVQRRNSVIKSLQACPSTSVFSMFFVTCVTLYINRTLIERQKVLGLHCFERTNLEKMTLTTLKLLYGLVHKRIVIIKSKRDSLKPAKFQKYS